MTHVARMDDIVNRHKKPTPQSAPAELRIHRVDPQAGNNTAPPAAPDPPPPQPSVDAPPGIGAGGAALALGGEYNVKLMLAPDGRSPLVDNGMSYQRPTQLWVLERVKELVAMYDDPLYSFMSRVGALTHNQALRTTATFGGAAVAELFRGEQNQEKFYHRMPGNTLDQQRRSNNYELLSEDVVFVDPQAAVGGVKRQATGAGNYPVVGKIGDDLDDDDDDDDSGPPVMGSFKPAAGVPPSPLLSSSGSSVLPGSSSASGADSGPPVMGGALPFKPAAAAPVVGSRAAVPPARPMSGASSSSRSSMLNPLPGLARPEPQPQTPAEHAAAHSRNGESNYVRAPDEGARVVPPHMPSGGNLDLLLKAGQGEFSAATLRGSARPAADGQSAVYGVRDTALNIWINGPDGKEGRPVYNIEDGDVVAARRLIAGQQMSDADERMWRTVYAGGVGVTRPAPRVGPEEMSARKQSQRAQIVQYAESIRDTRELQWKMLPEHLRVVFLTDEAAAALEHATWLAHYQQAWDGNALPTGRPAPIARERQMVPAIDLMTHEMVRVPFMSLVANVIIYWRQRRAADASRADESLRAINGIILTLTSMRESPYGFVSLLGHYDVEARRSRWETQQRRDAYQAQTGRYWSDMDPTFYSGAVAPGTRPGRHVASFMRRQQQQHPSGSQWQSMAMTAAVQGAVTAAPPGANPIAVANEAKFRYNFAMSVLGDSKRK